MLKKVKYGKIVIVFFLTVLIWVFADRALDTEYSLGNVMISISRSVSHNLWISFDDEVSVSINNVNVRGPASKISRLERQVNEGSFALEFFLNPEQVPSTGKLDVKAFLSQNKQIKELGLTVESCRPQIVSVRTVELVKKNLRIKCIDENENLQDEAIIKPEKIEMFVPAGWQGEKLTAYVQLPRNEISQAASSPVKKTPYILLTASQRKDASRLVEITMPPEVELLTKYNIKTPRLGIVFSQNLQGKYVVEKDSIDYQELTQAISIMATFEAKQAYESQRYQVILEIDDKDVDLEEPRRSLVYNFPKEFIVKNEIRLNQPETIARFKLKRISPAPSASARKD